MNEPKFQMLGTEIPPMLGRTNIMQRLWNDLTKRTPSHLALVGPRFAGKSVILKALEAKMRCYESPYCSVVLWDLGHLTPCSDDDFIRLLAKHLGEGLAKSKPEYGEYLLQEGAGYDEIRDVIGSMGRSGQMVLMLWDGFDKPLSGGRLTRNLWDNLLDLCRKPSFRIVTCTRKELHKLIRDEKSVTSDFWGIFADVVRVGVFDDRDIDFIMSQMSDLQFQTGSITEVINWSAGYPPLLVELLNQISVIQRQGQVDNATVNRAATCARERLSGILTMLWEDCPARARDLYTILMERSYLPMSEAGKEERIALIEKGFAQELGNKLLPACRFLQEHIKGAGPDTGSMSRLFGLWADYRSNIRSLLERRLAHISCFNDRLYRLVARAIEDIPDYPNDCLNNLTGIRDCALNLIWQREFGIGMTVPLEVITYWTESLRIENSRLVKSMMGSNSWKVPTDPLDQIRLLGLLTGSHRNFDARAKTTSKDTYVLIDAIHNLRNRAQHPDGQEIHLGVAVAAIMTCLELLACLEREQSA